VAKCREMQEREERRERQEREERRGGGRGRKALRGWMRVGGSAVVRARDDE
jgi:hypothetical protein